MKKYWINFGAFSLSTISLMPTPSLLTNYSTKKYNFQEQNKSQLFTTPSNSVENWYKFMAPNEWKVLITRSTWINEILAWIGDGLMGKMTNAKLRDKIFEEFKSWPSNGNRTFSDADYVDLVNYTFIHMIDISNWFFNNSKINRIVFKTYSNKEWQGIEDASI